MTDLWIATHNEGKVQEMRTIASSFPVTLKTAAEAGEFVDFPETGTSFDENALQKARALHQVTGDWVAADDSGLCVDSLGGAPGIYSARYSGEDANDRTNVALLLENMKNVKEEDRGAHFHCSFAVIAPDGTETIYHGQTMGKIALAPVGERGFGYDPVFIPEGETRTMAEMEPREKHRISHRGRALRAFLEEMF